MQRRLFSAAVGGVVAGLSKLAIGAGAGGMHDALRRIEAATGGRLGVCILDAATGRHFGYRAGERFPMCSTFKLLAAALVLQRTDAGLETLSRPVPIPAAADLVAYSPATQPRSGQTMTMAQLCEAAVTLSDNTAANLMLDSFGGPAGLTEFARALGDRVTRLDRIEPFLNSAEPGDPRDTTTPAAMAGLLQSLLVGEALKPASRGQLQTWMLANTTGAKQLRAGLPEDWRIGDKTGSGGHGTNNDVAIAWPPGKGEGKNKGQERAPLLVAAYLTEATVPVEQRTAALAKVGAMLPAILRGS